MATENDMIKYTQERLKEHYDRQQFYADKAIESDSNLYEEAEIALWAIDKQIAKKLVKQKHPVGDYKCPTCGACFIDGMGMTNYCGNCGQKLDSEEK